MAIRVRRADLISDRGIFIDTLARFLAPFSDDYRFEWLYLNGVHGAPQAWLAVDPTRDAVCGAAAAFPRRFHLGDDEVIGWVLGDFCLDPQYRSLGPALQLQRACLDILEEYPRTFCYDFPSPSMAAIYRRLGFSMTGKLVRMVMPLRVDRKMKDIFGDTSARQLVSILGNTVIRLGLPKRTGDKALEISLHNGRCGEEFTILADEQRGKHDICLRRSAEYLNWRYVDNPLVNYEITTARHRGKLKGYAVWTQAGGDASVVDLFGENSPAVVKALLADVVARLSDCHVMTLSIWLSDSHPWLSWGSEMGFRARDTVPMVCIPGPALGNSVNVRNAKWFLMQGDRDS